MKEKGINDKDDLNKENLTRNNEYRMDALREMGNIAAAHAATALSKLLSQDIIIDVSESHLYPVEELPHSLGHFAEKVAAVYIDIYKDERGIILFVFPYEKALRLSSMFLNKTIPANREMEEDDRAAISETGNICACAYLNAISKFLGITLIPSPPGLAIDMLEAILEFPASLIGENSEYALVIETKFVHDKEAFPGLILFMLEPKSQELVMKRFGINNV
jgi:chemotaxis protein CheC